MKYHQAYLILLILKLFIGMCEAQACLNLLSTTNDIRFKLWDSTKNLGITYLTSETFPSGGVRYTLTTTNDRASSIDAIRLSSTHCVTYDDQYR